jgi:hypothetical protein
MKTKLIRSFAALMLSAAAVMLTACGAPGYNNYSGARTIDPFPNHCFHNQNHCNHSTSHCSH